jgi:hypothetical protein
MASSGTDQTVTVCDAIGNGNSNPAVDVSSDCKSPTPAPTARSCGEDEDALPAAHLDESACPTRTPHETAEPCGVVEDVIPANDGDHDGDDPTACPTATPTPFQSFQGETATPDPTATPFQSFQGETATAAKSQTPPPTSSGSNGSSNGSTPIFALLICLAFGGLGLTAVEAQRRSARQ